MRYLVLLLAGCASLPPPPATTTLQIHSTVRITNVAIDGTYSGSGTLIAPDVILTAAHVVANGHLQATDSANATTCNAHTIKLAPKLDLALIKVDCVLGPYADLSPSEPLEGSPVRVVGYPAGIPSVLVTEGYVGHEYKNDYWLSAPAYGGNSGGGVWCGNTVCGVLVRGHQNYNHISIAVRLSTIKSFLD
jgi:S1-C subfamily serine protease